jgi:OOP family OmpA-OmpF porin
VRELLDRAREIRFKGASSKLSSVSLPFIGLLAEALGKDPSIQLQIISHTAASGDAKKDMGLSRRRAEAVKKALEERGVDGNRLTASGRGSKEPIAPNITQNGRRMNTRMELRVLAPDGK